MTTSTSEDAKSVSPMCSDDPWERECAARDEAQLMNVDEAMGIRGSPIIDPSDAIEAVPVLQSEVRRLREENQIVNEACELLRASVAALRDPQPPAAPTPKGEPYNGY